MDSVPHPGAKQGERGGAVTVRLVRRGSSPGAALPLASLLPRPRFPSPSRRRLVSPPVFLLVRSKRGRNNGCESTVCDVLIFRCRQAIAPKGEGARSTPNARVAE
ncbi:hypothetical protein GCM10010272_09470 [Streptomyces lateritius]|nr:hypothetical protein GCM10010272_09470 [Streptomyces lateritius]